MSEYQHLGAEAEQDDLQLPSLPFSPYRRFALHAIGPLTVVGLIIYALQQGPNNASFDKAGLLQMSRTNLRNASIPANVLSACPDCQDAETSLSCRACCNGLPKAIFCHECVAEGLNDIGCNECLKPHAVHEHAAGLLGRDVDQHGCLPSGGYRWCESMSMCIRPWEKGIHTMEAWNARCSLFCNCPPSEAMWNCKRPDYDAIINGTSCSFYRQHELHTNGDGSMVLTGGDKDQHGCRPSAGDRWCEAMSSCIRPWEKGIHSDAAWSASCLLFCNCPPSEAMWNCQRQDYDAIMNGTSCAFYKHQERTTNRSMVLMGGDMDKHGCRHSAGYQWCEAMSSCIRPWEKDIHTDAAWSASCSLMCNCPPSEAMWNCERQDYDAIVNGTSCAFYRHQEFHTNGSMVIMGGDMDKHGCRPSAGYRWCEAMSSCIRPWEKGIQTEEAFNTGCSIDA